ncbi:lyase family protein [Jatrophihabitans fulvus]
MTLFWPGDHRAGGLFGDAALVGALLAVEAAWLDALVSSGVAPAGAADALFDLVEPADVAGLAVDAEGGGNPVIPLLALLRPRVARRNETAAQWLHRGLTSQDVLDTALALLLRDTRDAVLADLRRCVTALVHLAERHRATPMAGRTLTQPAVPITFGDKTGSWLTAVLDAADDTSRLRIGAQFGGATGTRSGVAAVAGGSARLVVGATASALGLDDTAPWQTARAPVVRAGDALAAVTAACGRVANDVLTLSRPEIGELAEPSAEGRGGSSAMPQKANPTLSVLVRRAALTAPALVSLLHLAAADARDERPDGAWHVEWQPLQLLARHAVTAVSQTAELLEGLQVRESAMSRNLDAARPGVDSEREKLGGDGASDPSVLDAVLARARAFAGAP